ncbi:MAG: hypothetical protein C4523_02625 [Myxococcales bacterium]|nr:MAG: hypothetical protein C4523_02625 [Myxococcales bacterium]
MTLLLPKRQRIRDRRYLDSFAGRECEACGRNDGTTIPAHVRAGHEGGQSLKPDDSLVVALCFTCHADQEANPGPEWWLEKIMKPMLRERYRKWAAGNNASY